jgi:hypothetical protein
VDAVAPRRLRGEAMQFEIHWGDFGGTPDRKDGEIHKTGDVQAHHGKWRVIYGMC